MPSQGYCSVCSHEDALEINENLVLQGWSIRASAGHYGLNRESMRRHKEHIPKLLSQVMKRENLAVAEQIVADIKELQQEARDILIEARDTSNHELALKAMARVEKQLELQAKVLQVIKTQPELDILAIPAVARTLEILAQALDPYPDARYAASAALLEIEDGLP